MTEVVSKKQGFRFVRGSLGDLLGTAVAGIIAYIAATFFPGAPIISSIAEYSGLYLFPVLLVISGLILSIFRMLPGIKQDFWESWRSTILSAAVIAGLIRLGLLSNLLALGIAAALILVYVVATGGIRHRNNV